MNFASPIQPNKLTKKEARSARRNLLVFTFFLMVSFIFWYLNSLGKNLESDIRYPVKYMSLPKGMVLTEELPEKLTLSLQGPGYSIFKLKYSGHRSPAIIDISKVGYRRTQEGYYMLTGGLIKDFSTQLKTDSKIISIKPDTLFFSFEKSAVTNK